MLAVMLYQWAGRYKRATQQLRSTPHNRARVRALFSDAIDGLHLWVIEGVWAMIYLSMFLFFAGLLIYLFNIGRTAFVVVFMWMAFTTVMYASFTLRTNNRYCARLSSIFWSNWRRFVPFRAPRGGPYFRDSSGFDQVFSMYLVLAEQEDNKIINRWQEEAEWILIFVSPGVSIHTFTV